MYWGEKMKKLFSITLIASMLLAGCSVNSNNDNDINGGKMKGNNIEGYYFPSNEEMKLLKDNKMNDPQILEDDEQLHIGDVGTEELQEHIQNPPNEFDKKMNETEIIEHRGKVERKEIDGKEIIEKTEIIEEKKVIEEKEMKDEESAKNIPTSVSMIQVHHNPSYPQLHKVYPNPKSKPINGSYINNVVGKAWDYLGTSYEYGSDRNTDATFDCSDFVRWVHLWTLGMDLPKTSASQYDYVKKFAKRHYTDLSQAKRGDILFFMAYQGWQEKDYKGVNVKAQRVAHNGIYAGNDIIIHTASQKTGGVRFDEMKNSHLEYRFIGGASLF